MERVSKVWLKGPFEVPVEALSLKGCCGGGGAVVSMGGSFAGVGLAEDALLELDGRALFSSLVWPTRKVGLEPSVASPGCTVECACRI